MNNQKILEFFNKRLTVYESEFLTFIGEFKELKDWSYEYRTEAPVNIYIGLVDGRYFWYQEQDCKVWNDAYGFLDEIHGWIVRQ